MLEEGVHDMQVKNISIAVIKRLPRYYRYLGELLAHDVVRISSKELSEKWVLRHPKSVRI